MTSRRPANQTFHLLATGFALIVLAISGPASLIANENATENEKPPINQTIELNFNGPNVSETDEENPFTNYRLDVVFKHPRGEWNIRGFYDADGDAANSGADSGNVWSCRFAPPYPGPYRYTATLTKGDWVSIDPTVNGTRRLELENGEGLFHVTESKSEIPFFSRGRVLPKNRHYQHADGTTWLKFGTNSPENLLGYEDFDGTFRIEANSRSGEAAIGTPLHKYTSHYQDFREGDPTWKSGKGKGLVGGINYLASQGVNSIYFLTMNIEGDGKDVWPFLTPTKLTRFDCSKLDQWEIIFEHMLQQGLAIHFVTQETENELLLDNGDVGKVRKLYYSELISRFAHHPAVFWNIGEESGRSSWKDRKGLKSSTPAQHKAIADYLRTADPYGNTVVIHSHAGGQDQDDGLNPLLGHTTLDGISLQVHDPKDVHHDVQRWIAASQRKEHPWVVSMDEIGPADYGSPTDDVDPTQDQMRGRVLWGSLLAGAGGVEWYFGYKMRFNDLNSEDWRARQVLWQQSDIARRFFEQIDIAELHSADDRIVSGADYCMTDIANTYVIYCSKFAEPVSIDLSGTKNDFLVQWLDPVEGGSLKTGSKKSVAGGETCTLGSPPDSNRPGNSTDWVILLSKQ